MDIDNVDRWFVTGLPPKKLSSITLTIALDNSPTAIVEANESTNVSPAVRDVLLHSRETTLANLPEQLNRYAQWGDVRDADVCL